MMRRLLPLSAAVLLALQLAGCGAGTSSGDASVSSPVAGTEAIGTTSPAEVQIGGDANSSSPAAGSPAALDAKDAALLNAAKDVAEALRDRDLKRLADWIDPARGVRFSPYAHIDGKGETVWLPDRLPTFKESTKYVWGVYDGSGEPIELTFRDYFEKFVYDQDFAGAPDVTAGRLLGKGTIEFNVKEIYPDASFVEFHYPGFDDKYEGQDWESLILVFSPAGQDWRLCAVVHNQWTI